jgi:hypothetical protein
MCSGALTLKAPIMLLPVTVQGGVASKKEGLFALKEQVAGEESVMFRLPVTVTHVPGGPLSSEKFSAVSSKSLVPAWAGGTIVEERDRSIDESSSTTRYAEATLRALKSKHVTVIRRRSII